MELLAQPIGGAVLLLGQLIVQPRQFAKPDHNRLIEPHRAKAMHVGAQRIGQQESAAAVVLGGGRRVAVAEPVQLLGVDGEHGKAMFHERLHYGPRAEPSMAAAKREGESDVCCRNQTVSSARLLRWCSPAARPKCSRRDPSGKHSATPNSQLVPTHKTNYIRIRWIQVQRGTPDSGTGLIAS